MDIIEKDVALFAVSSRLIFLLTSSLFHAILPHHDPNVFVSPLFPPVKNFSKLDPIVESMLGGLSNWDAQHFYHISLNGYIYEHSLAFFPLYPIVLSTASGILSLFIGESLNPLSKLMLVSFFINCVLFTCSAIVLYRLSKIVLRNDAWAMNAAIFFCISPSSIFFLASYSETLFSFLVFSGMLFYAKGNLGRSSILFSLATACRSNGIINVGFILHYSIYVYFIACKKLKFKLLYIVLLLVKHIVKISIYVTLVIGPYILFQLYCYYLFCYDQSLSVRIPNYLVAFGISKGYKMPSDKILWCNSSLPFPYSYVQTNYWNVGLFKYYSMKQIPNFILAFPISLVLITYSIRFLYFYRPLFIKLIYIYEPNLKLTSRLISAKLPMLPRTTFVFTVHALFLVLFCIFNINIQVTTRIMCSSSPLLYWITALHFKSSHKINNFFSLMSTFGKAKTNVGQMLRLYFIIYVFLGLMLFSSNYPWT